jgi:hypothetical protein
MEKKLLGVCKKYITSVVLCNNIQNSINTIFNK